MPVTHIDTHGGPQPIKDHKHDHSDLSTQPPQPTVEVYLADVLNVITVLECLCTLTPGAVEPNYQTPWLDKLKHSLADSVHHCQTRQPLSASDLFCAAMERMNPGIYDNVPNPLEDPPDA